MKRFAGLIGHFDVMLRRCGDEYDAHGYDEYDCINQKKRSVEFDWPQSLLQIVTSLFVIRHPSPSTVSPQKTNFKVDHSLKWVDRFYIKRVKTRSWGTLGWSYFSFYLTLLSGTPEVTWHKVYDVSAPLFPLLEYNERGGATRSEDGR